jgi:hypothetical protein
LDLRIWIWGREAGEKKLGIFDLRKGFAKCTVGTKLEGRRFDLVGNTNPRQCSALTLASGSTATLNPRPFLKGRTLGLGVC